LDLAPHFGFYALALRPSSPKCGAEVYLSNCVSQTFFIYLMRACWHFERLLSKCLFFVTFESKLTTI
jgi:hypothetical protein